MKITQTGILWSQVQVLVGPPEIKDTSLRVGIFLPMLVIYQI